MSNEIYLNHPTFGLLYRLSMLDDKQELFTTLYAQRLFFVIKNTPNGVIFEPITRLNARLLVENRLRQLKRGSASSEYQQLEAIHKRTFQ
jgi:PII interaction protein X